MNRIPAPRSKSSVRGERVRGTMLRGFTLIELLVVIVIIALVLGIAIPTFAAQLSSTKRSLAENSVQTAITVARDLALRNAGGDAAAVFFFDPEGGTRIVPMVQVNQVAFYDDDLSGGDRVARAWLLAFGRPAEPAEQDEALAFVAEAAAAGGGEAAGWEALAWAVLTSNETIYVD